jgi:hypothetical protein
MPSARELLEQADALMQKNRARVDPDIPVLMDAVEQRSLDVSDEIADVPLLTDVVEEVLIEIPPPAKIAPRASAVSTMSFEGDPSDWLVMDTIDPATHSITGGDTLDVIPPYSTKAAGSARTPPPAHSTPRSSPERLDPLGLPPRWSKSDVDPRVAAADSWRADDAASRPEDALGVTSAAEADISPDGANIHLAQNDVESTIGTSPAPVEVQARATALNVIDLAESSGAFETRAAIATEAVSADVIEATPASASEATLAPMVPVASPRPVQEDALAETSEFNGDSAQAIVAAVAMAPAVDAAEADRARLRAAELEEERWQALSEQISMQVLQRVDLFTDTGLKDQLADRLKPIVARASAELVGTITDHVGQLLRTYVAEAIEREIAAWRSGQR